MVTYLTIQAQTTFNARPNNGNWGISNTIFITDSVYAIAGVGGAFRGQKKLRVSTFDYSGNLKKEQLHGANYEIIATGFYGNGTKISDNKYVIAGGAIDENGKGVARMFFLDQTFDSILFRDFNAYRFQQFNQCRWNKKTKEIIAFGYVNHPVSISRFWLSTSDSLGNQIWDTLYGTSTHADLATTIGLCKDGGYILGGWTDSYGVPNVNGNSNVWIIKTDFNGKVEWDRVFGDSLTEAVFSVFEGNDGNFYFSGGRTDYEDPFSRNNDEYSLTYIMKLDNKGNTIWDNSFGTLGKNNTLFSLNETPDGSLIGCGSKPGRYYKDGIPGIYGYVIKVSSDGELLWERVHHHPDAFDKDSQAGVRGILYSIKPTPDGGYIAAGETNTNDNSQDFWVIKMDERGCIGTPCDLQEAILAQEEIAFQNGIQSFNVFPNPASDMLNLSFSFPVLEEAVVQLVDQSGKVVLRQFIANASDVLLDLSAISSGIYFVSVQSAEYTFPVKKVVVK